MKFPPLHSWKMTPAEGIKLQKDLAKQVDDTSPLTSIQTIAGADVSYNRYSPRLYACVVVFKLPDFEVIEERYATALATFPYRTGMLSFREAPVLLQAFRKVQTRPDVVMVDGQGRAHPRRLGLASHLGLWLRIPTIGCAKSRLCGEFADLNDEAGSTAPLKIRSEVVGAVLRSKRRCQPLYVSVGHRIRLDCAIAIVLAMVHRHRIPEPTRIAHECVNDYRRRYRLVKSEHE